MNVRKRPMMVIFPGGGYSFCSEREAEPVALEFVRAGFHTCIVRYTTRPDKSLSALGDKPLQEAAAALVYIRTHAEEWNVDADKISILGFSAGGHLTASLGVHWNDTERVPNGGELARPNAMVLCYSVLTAGDETHRGTIQNLTGIDTFSDEDAKYDNTAFVSPDTPPTFLWHTYEDGAVPVVNSLTMAEALRKAGVPFALHIFTKGPHGLSVVTEEVGGGPNGVGKWVELCIDWLNNMNMA